MSILRLVLREIAFRKLNFGLALLAALIAVACLTGVLIVMHKHDLVTDEIMAKHEDGIRKATLKLGFNILILHKDQKLSDLYSDDFASKYMPEDYGQRLVKAKVITIKHLLPNLQERVFWKEGKRTVHLYGTRGEIDKSDKKPLLDAVPAGKVVVGFELHQGLNIKKGDKLKLSFVRETRTDKEDLQPIELVVHDLLPQRGPSKKDDNTLFVNLNDAQRILNRKGLINSLLALECDCGSQRLANIREEIARVLPETRVEEYHSEALARAEARNQAALKRAEIRGQQETFAAVLVPLVVLGCTILLGVLAFVNVQDRVLEIGILRALGVGSARVFALFLTKAIVVGLLGALTGYFIGAAAGIWIGESPAKLDPVAVIFNGALITVILVAAPLLCALASFMPALRAARQDPAVVLQQE